ncbi:MAG: ribbon-helix-helix domain-containing protein [Ignisphaera sp.]
MTRKKRFGISIDSSLACEIDRLAKILGIDRSKLVEKALTNFVNEYSYSHAHENHFCRGVIIVETDEGEKIDRAIESFKDVVLSYTHNHLENTCICMFIVSGNSERIKDLHRNLLSVGCGTRYIPIGYTIGHK